MTDLSRKRTRDSLQPRREPYWQRLAKGAYLGFRRGPDTWIARFRGRDKEQQYHPLGEALEFDAAMCKRLHRQATVRVTAKRRLCRPATRRVPPHENCTVRGLESGIRSRGFPRT